MDREGKGRLVQNAVFRYGLALLCMGVAFAVRYLLNPLIGSHEPFMIFGPVTLVVGRFGGLGPGLLSVLIGLFLGDFFFTPPLHSFGPYGPTEVTEMVTYTVTTVAGVILLHVLERSRVQVRAAVERTESAAAEAQRRGAELEREIGERRRAEADLQQAQKQLSNYASELEQRVAERTDKLQQSLGSLESVLYHVAHDLRAPLRAMQGFTTILLKDYVGKLDDRGKDYARRISDASRRMDELLRDLLEYGRVCSAEIFSSKVDLESVIKGLLNEASGEIQEKSAVIEVAKPLPPVWADARMVREIILQMLNNALKFNRPGVAPEIRISAEPRDGRIRLWMQDNGVGIDSEHFDRIFRVFERLHVHEHLSGTGIGLAIVRRAAERSGGAAGVESRVGKGSRFWVEFPAA